MNASASASWSTAGLVRAGIGLTLCELPGELTGIVSLVPLLLLVAFWNGFPLIYYDTGAYVLEGLGHHFLVERSPVYSLFLDFAGAGFSLWTIVVLQAAATAFVIVECVRNVAPRMALGGLLLLSAGLIVATGLPWYVGEVEPDCFAPIAVLALYLLAFHAHAPGSARTWALLALTAFAAAAHTSHLLLALTLLGAIAAVHAIRTFSKRAARWPKPNFVMPALSLVIAAGLVLTSNFLLTRKVFVSRAGPSFLFARLLQDGIVMRLLEDTCPRSGYRLCAYKDLLPPTANAWLWAPYSPFFKLGGFDGTRAESERIVADSFTRYPMMNLEAVLADAARQLVSFRTGDQVEPQQWAIQPTFSTYLRTQVAPYLSARQQEGEIGFQTLNLLHVPVGYLSLLAMLGLLGVSIWRAREGPAAFLGFVFLALVGNALICGALSNPHDRYQSRLIWLVPLAVALVSLEHAKAVADGDAPAPKVFIPLSSSSESPCGAQSNPALIDTQAHCETIRSL